MVEFALISIFLFTLIFGIIEGAFAVRARNAVNNAVQDATREGAVAGNAPDADFRIINQLVGRGVVSAAEVQYVVVYTVPNSGAPMDALCEAGSPVSGKCNVYYPPFTLNPAAYGCGSPGGSAWCSTTRAPDGGALEFLGVYVRANHRPIINQLLADWTFPVDVTALQAIETSGEL